MAKSNPTVGIIAEDDSDVDSMRVLLRRIADNNSIGINKFVGKGCGKIKRKSNAWARQLHQKGCRVLILVHDLDRNTIENLRITIENALSPCPFKNHLICIPVQELEAWFLSDPAAVKDGLNLRNVPKIKDSPERINSPKEYLGEIIHKASKGEKIYINTKHNEKIAAKLSIEKVVRLCPSFKPLHDFAKQHLCSN